MCVCFEHCANGFGEKTEFNNMHRSTTRIEGECITNVARQKAQCRGEAGASCPICPPASLITRYCLGSKPQDEILSLTLLRIATRILRAPALQLIPWIRLNGSQKKEQSVNDKFLSNLRILVSIPTLKYVRVNRYLNYLLGYYLVPVYISA